MSAEPQVDGLYVLSDLHLAPAGEQCVFRAHAPLVALIDRIAAAPAPQWLLLNGDVFDFLQIPGYACRCRSRRRACRRSWARWTASRPHAMSSPPCGG